MVKPVGPVCNMRCEYCFYTEKGALYPDTEAYLMPEAVLEAYVHQYLGLSDSAGVEFTWQGGEPTLAGLDFFRRAVSLQDEYGRGTRITNSLQTNGLLLDAEWCEFLSDRGFLVGISLDGPAAIHNRYRVTRGGHPTFDAVIKALRMLQAYEVDYNVLCCVTAQSAARQLDIYRFFKSIGVRHIQFIPVVERPADAAAESLGLRLGTPAADPRVSGGVVTAWSVAPEAYGDFLIRIFDEWLEQDVGSVFVMNFEWALCAWMGLASPVCWSARRCGRSVVLEHNGDVYACDHFVYPRYKLGNLMERPLEEILCSPLLDRFGAEKEVSLPGCCMQCSWLFACRGGCQKHRFHGAAEGGRGLNYLCEGYRKFFAHVDPHMRRLARLLTRGNDAWCR
jgi:uncharacterized protein